MIGSRPKVFISYSSKDRAYAERLVSALVLNAVQVWYDQRDLKVGQQIHDKIQESLLQVDFLGVLLTRNSLASTWVKEELTLAKQRELEERNVVILPLLFEQVSLPLHLRSRKYADFSDFDSGFRELMLTLGAQAAVSVFDDSLRQRVFKAVSTFGSGTAAEIQEIRSQTAAKLVRGTTLAAAQVTAQLNAEPAGVLNPATIFVDIQSAEIDIPIQVDLSERCGSVLARVLQAVSLDQLVLELQQYSFFLVYEGIPLELNERLSDANIKDRAHLQLGAYTFMIE